MTMVILILAIAFFCLFLFALFFEEVFPHLKTITETAPIPKWGLFLFLSLALFVFAFVFNPSIITRDDGVEAGYQCGKTWHKEDMVKWEGELAGKFNSFGDQIYGVRWYDEECYGKRFHLQKCPCGEGVFSEYDTHLKAGTQEMRDYMRWKKDKDL